MAYDEKTYYGSYVGPSCTFRTVVQMRVSSQGESSCTVQRRRYVQTTGGSFGGTSLRTSWSDNVNLYSNGTYADTGWETLGTYSYGSSISVSENANYTSYSGNYYSSTASGTYKPSTPVFTPSAPSSLTAARESDSKNTLAWTNNTSTTRPYSSIKIERSTDGGSWSEIASVGSSATSYADTTTSADHTYQYRIRAYNSAGYSSYATCATVLKNTPSAPTKITAARSGETTVELTVENAARTATALEIHRSSDKSTWEYVAMPSGSPVTSATDSPGGGTFYYRARNVGEFADGGVAVSDWSPVSDAVVTICAPAAPTLVSPASGSTVNMAQGSVTFEWVHNPIDGSAQTAAMLRVSTDGGVNYDYYTIDGNASTFELVRDFDLNSTVTWGVCTKGAYEGYGDWSDNRVLYIRQQPSVYFSSPADGFVVKTMPIAIHLQYDDPSGKLANLSISIFDGTYAAEGAGAVYTRDMGTDTTCSILASEWLPEDGRAYTLIATVRSTSSLSAVATRDVTAALLPPLPATLEVVNDEETGCAVLTVGVQSLDYPEDTAVLGVAKLGVMRLGVGGTLDGEEYEDAVGINVYRVTESGRTILGENLQAGASIVDRYAPVGVDYSYEAVTFSEIGSYNTQSFPAFFGSPWFYCMFGTQVARGKWNPSGTIKLTRPSRISAWYAGRKYPVSYDNENISEVANLSLTLKTRDEEQAFRALMEAGRGVYKSADGSVHWADFEVSLKPSYAATSYGTASITVTRTDGGEL